MIPAELLAKARDVAFWRALAPSLHIGRPPTAPWNVAPDVARERVRLLDAGWSRIERIVPAATSEALVSALQSLQNARIPTPCVFVFDEAWDVASGLAHTFAAVLDVEVARVLPDVWAWLVPADAGARGWAPHRGVTMDVRDARGGPTLINAWVALSDVSIESACIHVVPLADDPFFPNALDRIDVDASLALPLPVSRGSLLAWNANVLHWGGEMKPGAPPRASLSFSIRTNPSPHDFAPENPPPFDARVDLVADMLLTYAPTAGVSGAWLEWARLWSGMRDVRR